MDTPFKHIKVKGTSSSCQTLRLGHPNPMPKLTKTMEEWEDEELKKAIVKGTEFTNFAQRFKMDWWKQVEERTGEILYIPESILDDLARIAFDIINP